jgi:hypothetical protein
VDINEVARKRKSDSKIMIFFLVRTRGPLCKSNGISSNDIKAQIYLCGVQLIMLSFMIDCRVWAEFSWLSKGSRNVSL